MLSQVLLLFDLIYLVAYIYLVLSMIVGLTILDLFLEADVSKAGKSKTVCCKI